MPTILTQEPSSQAIEAGCSKDLGVMDPAQELNNEVHKDALVVKGGLNIQGIEVVLITVYLWLLPGADEDYVGAVNGMPLNDANPALMGARLLVVCQKAMSAVVSRQLHHLKHLCGDYLDGSSGQEPPGEQDFLEDGVRMFPQTHPLRSARRSEDAVATRD